MKVEMIVLTFPRGSPITYDSKDESIKQILIENDKIKVDFVDNGRNWAREIPISNLKFFEYPTDTAVYAAKEGEYKPL